MSRAAGKRVANLSGVGYQRLTRCLYWATFAAFAVAGAVLAGTNQWWGSPDSLTNAQTARSLAAGGGYRSGIVSQLLVPEDLEVESLRSPGVPYALALAFRLFGERPAVPVALNVALVLLASLLLRRAVARHTERWLGDLAGLLMLLGSHYELVSIWNNNFLTAAAAAFVLLVVTARAGTWTRIETLALGAGLTAVTAVFKWPLAAGMVPALALLAATQPPARVRCRRRAILLLLLAAVTAGGSILLARERGRSAFPSPVLTMVTAVKFHAYVPPERDRHLNTRKVLLERPPTPASAFADARRARGTAAILGDLLEPVPATLFWMVRGARGLVLAVLVLGLAGVRRSGLVEAGSVAVLLLFPLAEALFTHHEARYLWPAWPLLLFLAAHAAHRAGSRRFAGLPPAASTRLTAGASVLALAMILLAGYQSSYHLAARLRRGASFESPGWVEAVGATPAGAVFLAGRPYDVGWYGRRAAVATPFEADADGLRAVLRHYRPQYLLVSPDHVTVRLFPAGALALIDRGDGWVLYRIGLESALSS